MFLPFSLIVLFAAIIKTLLLFYRFYRFAAHDDFHGGHDGNVRWADSLLGPSLGQLGGNLQPSMPEWDHSGFLQGVKDVLVSPLDVYNLKLLDNVHPQNWKNPEPGPDKYNLVVVGAGAGGLVSAAASVGLGAKVAIIEEHMMGGDCLNVGCVPSKAIIRCARAVHEAQHMHELGVSVAGIQVHFEKIMERMRRIRSRISANDSCTRYAGMGVDVFQGRGKFMAKNAVEVNGKKLVFAACVIATGATASVPPISGLADVKFLTNASFFNLTELPKRFGVLGTGVIGLELAQTMARFGSKVVVMGRAGRIMAKEDPEAAAIIHRQLLQDGVQFKLRCVYHEIRQQENGIIEIDLTDGGVPEVVEVDQLLVASGRTPNVMNVGLEAAGVEYDTEKGIKVNDYLQTTNKSIYAVGDCCTQYKFTHVADFMARLVVRNALFYRSSRMSSILIPWATFTEPEVAHVGLYESDMRKHGIAFNTFVKYFDEVDRAICDGQEEGFVKVHVKEGTDKIIGATIVAHDAGNMISEIAVAMQAGFGLGSVANVIHPYPTQAEAIRMCGDLYNRTRLTTMVKSMFRNILAWRRR